MTTPRASRLSHRSIVYLFVVLWGSLAIAVAVAAAAAPGQDQGRSMPAGARAQSSTRQTLASATRARRKAMRALVKCRRKHRHRCAAQQHSLARATQRLARLQAMSMHQAGSLATTQRRKTSKKSSAPSEAPTPTESPSSESTSTSSPSSTTSSTTTTTTPPSSVEAPLLTVTGTIYYVSQSGSDSNAGTSPTSAWRSVRRVDEARLQPGDGVLFEGGATFADETLMPKGSGAAGHPIVFGSYGAGSAVLPQGVWFKGLNDLAFEHLVIGPEGNLQGTGDEVTVEWCSIGNDGLAINATGANSRLGHR